LDQISLADPGTTTSGIAPKGPVSDQFGPEGEEATLSRFDCMDGTAVGFKKAALAAFRLPESEQMLGAIDVAGFELGGGQFNEGGGPDHVILGEIDVAPRVATFDATPLAAEA